MAQPSERILRHGVALLSRALSVDPRVRSILFGSTGREVDPNDEVITATHFLVVIVPDDFARTYIARLTPQDPFLSRQTAPAEAFWELLGITNEYSFVEALSGNNAAVEALSRVVFDATLECFLVSESWRQQIDQFVTLQCHFDGVAARPIHEREWQTFIDHHLRFDPTSGRFIKPQS